MKDKNQPLRFFPLFYIQIVLRLQFYLLYLQRIGVTINFGELRNEQQAIF